VPLQPKLCLLDSVGHGGENVVNPNYSLEVVARKGQRNMAAHTSKEQDNPFADQLPVEVPEHLHSSIVDVVNG